MTSTGRLKLRVLYVHSKFTGMRGMELDYKFRWSRKEGLGKDNCPSRVGFSKSFTHTPKQLSVILTSFLFFSAAFKEPPPKPTSQSVHLRPDPLPLPYNHLFTAHTILHPSLSTTSYSRSPSSQPNATTPDHPISAPEQIPT